MMIGIDLKKAALGCLFFLIGLAGHSQQTILIADSTSQQAIPMCTVIVHCPEGDQTHISDVFGKIYVNGCSAPAPAEITYFGITVAVPDLFGRGDTVLIPLPIIKIDAVVINPVPWSVELQPIARPQDPIPPVSVILATLRSGSQASLLQTMNSLPGVKMDERGYGGSRRLSVRGSFVRSPFAVRNLSIYLRQIPVTGPEGSSPLELFDPDDLSNIRIAKGPTAGMWGTQNGGAVLLDLQLYRPEKLFFQTGTTVGSFGFYRQTSGLSVRSDKGYIRFSHAYQETSGYRDQEYNRKNSFNLWGEWNAAPDRKFFIWANRYFGNWGLPGSLNAAEQEEDPTQARPYSEKVNASLERLRTTVAVSQEYIFHGSFENTTAIYLYEGSKLNPYGTSPFFSGYKDETELGYGFRSVFEKSRLRNITQFRWTYGLEWQRETGDYDEYDFASDASIDGLRYQNQSAFERGAAFLDLKLIRQLWMINPTVSLSRYSVRNEGTRLLSGDLDASVNDQPRLLTGLEILRAGNRIAYGAKVKQGISDPSLFELVDVETGILNTDLEPEKGLNIEGMLKREWQRGVLNLNVYHFLLSQSIIPEYEDQDMLSYRNGGNAQHSGLEIQINRSDLYSSARRMFNRLNTWVGYAFQHYVNADGDRIPGVALHTVSSGIELYLIGDWQLNVVHYWSDKMPLNEDNSAWLNAYHQINISSKYGRSIGSHFEFELHAGINNLTDARYTSFAQINAAFGRYYNPSPERNFFGGVKLAYLMR